MPRQLPPYLRSRALFLIGRHGMTAEAAAREIGVNVNTVRAWWHEHRLANDIPPAQRPHPAKVRQAALRLVFHDQLTPDEAAKALRVKPGVVQHWANQHRKRNQLLPPERGHPDALREEALRLVIEQGLSSARAAREVGVPPGTVAHWAKEHRKASGLPPIKARHRAEVKQEAVRLVIEDGLTYAQAALRTGTSETAVGQWAKEHRARHNLPPPSKGHPEHIREEALRLVLEDGLSRTQAAKQTGAHTSTVEKWAARHIHELHGNPAELQALAIRLATQRNQPLPDIATRLRIPLGALVRWLHDDHRAKRGKHR
jgi:transposase-like protein